MKARPIFCGILVLANCVRGQGTVMAISGANNTPLDGYSPYSVAYFYNTTAGWSFTPSQNIEVTALGSGPEDINMVSDVEFGLWDANGTLLASASLSGGSGNSVASQTFTSINPILLDAGDTYTVGGWGGDNAYVTTIALEPILAPQIQPLDYGLIGDGFVFPAPNEPVDDGQGTVLPIANFQFEVVPEPSTLWLVGAGFGAFGLRHARYKGINHRARNRSHGRLTKNQGAEKSSEFDGCHIRRCRRDFKLVRNSTAAAQERQTSQAA